MEMYDSQRAAAALNVTERTLQKWTKAGRIRFETIRKHGGGVKRLYNGEDVQRVKKENADGAVVVVPKDQPTVPKVNPKQLFEKTVGEEALALFKQYVAIERERDGAERPVEPHVWLKLDDAAKLLGLPKAFLRRAIEAGKLPAIKAGSVFIKRAHLEAFEG